MNKLYLDQNLVIGYLAKNPINFLELSNESGTTGTTDSS